jgi:hypothetical protein
MQRTNFARAFEVMYDTQGVVNVSGFRIAYQDAPQQGNKYVDTFFYLALHKLPPQVMHTSYFNRISCTHKLLTE